MRIILTLLLVGLYLSATAQTVIEHMATTNNDDVLAMTITGKRDGNSFRHALRFDVKGMTIPQRDSLYEQTLRTLGILGIANVPGQKTSSTVDTTSEKPGGTITFRCETCSGKGRLEVYGNGYTVTRVIDHRPDEAHSFPMRIRFAPGDYRLLYYEKHGLKYVLQTQSTFTAKSDEAGTVTVK